jgi:hypothetical protein
MVYLAVRKCRRGRRTSIVKIAPTGLKPQAILAQSMYGLKPVPFKLKPLPFKLMPRLFKFAPAGLESAGTTALESGATLAPAPIARSPHKFPKRIKRNEDNYVYEA